MQRNRFARSLFLLAVMLLAAIPLHEAAADELSRRFSDHYLSDSRRGNLPPADFNADADDYNALPGKREVLATPEGEPLWEELEAVKERLAALEHLPKPETEYPTIKFNGAFQADVGFFAQTLENIESVGPIADGADFRRARLGAGGSVTDNMKYFFQMDFAFYGRPSFTDVWVEWTDLPVLNKVRVGQWKQPFSLEVVSSYRYTMFMERSVLFIPFTPFRHIGIGFMDHAENLNWTWAASAFRTGNDHFGDSISFDGGVGAAARATHLLWYDEATHANYLHLGAGYYGDMPPDYIRRFRTIPEMWIGENAPGPVGTAGIPIPGVINGTPFFVDTGPLFDVEFVNTFGGEFLWVNGPWTVQSEVMAAAVERREHEQSLLYGSYIEVAYFLTGEHRPYDRHIAAIERVIPHCNFSLKRDGERGIGAWEIAARWSYINLNSGDIRGGSMNDFTAGVNWYCNPYCKVVFNYVHSWLNDRNGVNSDCDIYAARVQLDF